MNNKEKNNEPFVSFICLDEITNLSETELEKIKTSKIISVSTLNVKSDKSDFGFVNKFDSETGKSLLNKLTTK